MFLSVNNLEQIKETLTKRNLKLSCGESCTGGLISSLLTDVEGASNFIEINFVTYSPYAKIRFLNVPKSVIDKYGVVSIECAEKMAKGLLKYSGISIATTGYASSVLGDTKNKKGTVYFAFAHKNTVKSFKYISLKEDRKEVKKDMAEHVLFEFLNFLNEIFD